MPVILDKWSCIVSESAVLNLSDGRTTTLKHFEAEDATLYMGKSVEGGFQVEADSSLSVKLPRTVLICHADDPLNREGLARWLADATSLVGVVVLEEPRSRMKQRIKREIKRVGLLRFLDVLAFRLYYKLFLAGKDRDWEKQTLKELCDRFAPLSERVRVLHAPSPNAPEVETFLREANCDIVIARCKTLLKPGVFSIPKDGTFVMHPGICPQYRNAHGCFWALAQNDRANVGMTLLKIDRGVDTGPVYGFYRCTFDEAVESHHVIQHKVVFENLNALRDKLIAIHEGRAETLDTRGAPSGEWGQPWLSAYWRYRQRCRRSNS